MNFVFNEFIKKFHALVSNILNISLGSFPRMPERLSLTLFLGILDFRQLDAGRRQRIDFLRNSVVRLA